MDTIGCDQLYDHGAKRSVQRYQILLSLMLSSQTRDQVTAAAMERLRRVGCTQQNVAQMKQEELASLLTPVSFFNNKARFIIEATKTILDKHNGDVPSKMEELLELPGVGPKMAHLFVQAADGKTLGIGVDVHVHRIARRFHWTPPSVRTPEDSRVALESWLPKEHWREINHLLVGLGQTICTPRHPKCDSCSLSALCPSAFVESTRKPSTTKDLEEPAKSVPPRRRTSKPLKQTVPDVEDLASTTRKTRQPPQKRGRSS